MSVLSTVRTTLLDLISRDPRWTIELTTLMANECRRYLENSTDTDNSFDVEAWSQLRIALARLENTVAAVSSTSMVDCSTAPLLYKCSCEYDFDRCECRTREALGLPTRKERGSSVIAAFSDALSNEDAHGQHIMRELHELSVAHREMGHVDTDTMVSPQIPEELCVNFGTAGNVASPSPSSPSSYKNIRSSDLRNLTNRMAQMEHESRLQRVESISRRSSTARRNNASPSPVSPSRLSPDRVDLTPPALEPFTRSTPPAYTSPSSSTNKNNKNGDLEQRLRDARDTRLERGRRLRDGMKALRERLDVLSATYREED
eukprot:PhM_4_TR3140/c0_g1_i1/m.66097